MAKEIKWNFASKNGSAKFGIEKEEIATSPFTFVSNSPSKVNPDRSFGVIEITTKEGVKRFMVEEGAMNESGINAVCDAAAAKKGVLVLKPNAVITVTGGVIAFAIAS